MASTLLAYSDLTIIIKDIISLLLQNLEESITNSPVKFKGTESRDSDKYHCSLLLSRYSTYLMTIFFIVFDFIAMNLSITHFFTSYALLFTFTFVKT